MSGPHEAPWYADGACQVRATLLENVPLARDTHRLRFDAPQIARRIVPGQFVMLRLAGCDDPLLGRPLALWDTVLDQHGEPTGIDLVYLVVGKLTGRLAHSPPGTEVDVWGPLGNGFLPQATEHLVMVAGGIGQTPFVALAKEYLGKCRYGQVDRSTARAARITLFYGARSRDFLAGVEDFERLGVEVHISTNDGTAGRRGYVTDLLADVLADATDYRIVCCGPEPMMELVDRFARARGVACQASLESPMACGIGICFSCVARVRQADGGWDYRRTCVEGPVFESSQICWH